MSFRLVPSGQFEHHPIIWHVRRLVGGDLEGGDGVFDRSDHSSLSALIADIGVSGWAGADVTTRLESCLDPFPPTPEPNWDLDVLHRRLTSCCAKYAAAGTWYEAGGWRPWALSTGGCLGRPDDRRFDSAARDLIPTAGCWCVPTASPPPETRPGLRSTSTIPSLPLCTWGRVM